MISVNDMFNLENLSTAPTFPIEGYKVFPNKILYATAFANVFLGMKESSQHLVAVKQLQRKFCSEEMIEGEIDAQKRFSHPAIIQLFDVIRTEDSVYLIMELAKDGSLERYLIDQGGKLTEHQIRIVSKNIGEAMNELFKANMLHRNLKPDSILVFKEPQLCVKIAEFELAKDAVLACSCDGTLCYMAPEMGNMKISQDKVDMWSVGSILYQLKTGNIPAEIVDDKGSLPDKLSFDGFSPELEDLVKNLMNFSPMKRMNWPQFQQHPFVIGTTKE